MKKLLFICGLFLGITPMVSAQQASTNNEPTAEEYETMIENHYKVEFRNMAFKAMELTEDEITALDPLYSDYVSRKMEIADRRNRLVAEYRDEMQEDDDAAEKDDERADFIENYWETQIKEMELRKDYFDRFEDVVSTDKAVQFFLLEEKTQSRMEEVNLIGIVPMMIKMKDYHPNKKKDGKMKKDKMKEDSSMNWDDDNTSSEAENKRMANRSEWSEKDQANSEKDWTNKSATDKDWSEKSAVNTDTDSDWSAEGMSDETTADRPSEATATYTTSTSTTGLSAFNQWVAKEGNGVSINHEYTSNGLESLVGAIWAVAEEHNIDPSAWSGEKERIMTITEKLRKNPTSTDHADMAREAFTVAATMINGIQEKKGTDKTKGFASQVKSAANAINPDRLMTDQANDIYAYFSYANEALKAFSSADEKWERTSASTQDNK